MQIYEFEKELKKSLIFEEHLSIEFFTMLIHGYNSQQLIQGFEDEERRMAILSEIQALGEQIGFKEVYGYEYRFNLKHLTFYINKDDFIIVGINEDFKNNEF